MARFSSRRPRTAMTAIRRRRAPPWRAGSGARARRVVPELLVIGDACLCEYTDHGHCGVVQDGEVDNDASVYLLGKVAVTQARAGIDIVAPSDMMDGRVAGIRKALDAAGFSRVPCMSYAATMASAFC